MPTGLNSLQFPQWLQRVFMWQGLGAGGFTSKEDKIAVLWYSECKGKKTQQFSKGLHAYIALPGDRTESSCYNGYFWVSKPNLR